MAKKIPKSSGGSITERLLRDIDDAHFALLSRLADDAEERSDRVWADGWRFLALNHLWPAHVRERAGDDLVSRWEWWRLREGDARRYGCSLPRLLCDHVRRAARGKVATPSSFATPGAALACAAWCAGNLIALFGSVEEPGQSSHPKESTDE